MPHQGPMGWGGGSPWGKGGGGGQPYWGGGGGFGGMPWMGGGGAGGDEFQEWLQMMNAWSEFQSGYGQEEEIPITAEVPPPGTQTMAGDQFKPPPGVPVPGADDPAGPLRGDRRTGQLPFSGQPGTNLTGMGPGSMVGGGGGGSAGNPVGGGATGGNRPGVGDELWRGPGSPFWGGGDGSPPGGPYPGLGTGQAGARFGRPTQPYQGFRPTGRLAGGLGRMGGNRSKITPSGNTPWG